MGDIKIDTQYGKGIQQGIAKDKIQDGNSFKDFVKSAIEGTNSADVESNKNIEDMVKGKVGIHEAMLSLQKTDISLRLLLQIRNKAIDAYREIMRMPF